MKTTTILLFMLFTHLICFSQNKTFKWFEGKNVYEGTYDNNKHTKEEINQCYLLSINRYFEINTFFIEYVYSDNDYINRCKQIKNHLKYIDSIYAVNTHFLTQNKIKDKWFCEYCKFSLKVLNEIYLHEKIFCLSFFDTENIKRLNDLNINYKSDSVNKYKNLIINGNGDEIYKEWEMILNSNPYQSVKEKPVVSHNSKYMKINATIFILQFYIFGNIIENNYSTILHDYDRMDEHFKSLFTSIKKIK